jgi:hypothetical protein
MQRVSGGDVASSLVVSFCSPSTQPGRAIRNEADLVAAIRSTGAMQTVKIKLMRNSRRMTVMQPLGEP